MNARRTASSATLALALALALLAACKSPGPEASAADASSGAIATASAAAPAPPSASNTVPEGAGPADAGPGSPGDAGAEGELTLDVQGGYCPPDRKNVPGCRSYTLVLSASGALRGGHRKSAVAAEEVEAMFRLASEAFAAKPACIPNAPDRGSQAISLRGRGAPQVARGGCGPRFQEIQTRLEKLAAAD